MFRDDNLSFSLKLLLILPLPVANQFYRKLLFGKNANISRCILIESTIGYAYSRINNVYDDKNITLSHVLKIYFTI